jgi:cytochrome c-type biogenesis protein CcmE
VKRYDKLVWLALVVVFGTGISMTAQTALSSYSTFAEAEAQGRNVQVKGVAQDGSWRQIDAGSFTFLLTDKSGQSYTVKHRGNVPPNLFTADYAVVVGRVEGGLFVARNILVKCPTRFMQEGSR